MTNLLKVLMTLWSLGKKESKIKLFVSKCLFVGWWWRQMATAEKLESVNRHKTYMHVQAITDIAIIYK